MLNSPNAPPTVLQQGPERPVYVPLVRLLERLHVLVLTPGVVEVGHLGPEPGNEVRAALEGFGGGHGTGAFVAG